jgi:Ser-tRNA(Ala) deacylase AlaX
VKKKFDPRMHSAEHLLNHTMDSLFGCGRCFSAHIEKKKSKCDYHFHRELTEEEIKEIENRVNRVIQENLPVEAIFVTRKEAEATYNLERLPSEAGDRIRIIRIGDYDTCPCIGPHVKTTGEIAGFRITTTSYNKDVLRVRFKLNRPG